MDKLDQTVVNAVFAGFGALISFMLTILWNSLKDLQKADIQLMQQVASVQLLVTGDYVKKDEFARLAERLYDKLDSIENKLDSKADK